jgi:hypothetical protein
MIAELTGGNRVWTRAQDDRAVFSSHKPPAIAGEYLSEAKDVAIEARRRIGFGDGKHIMVLENPRHGSSNR